MPVSVPVHYPIPVPTPTPVSRWKAILRFLTSSRSLGALPPASPMRELLPREVLRQVQVRQELFSKSSGRVSEEV